MPLGLIPCVPDLSSSCSTWPRSVDFYGCLTRCFTTVDVYRKITDPPDQQDSSPQLRYAMDTRRQYSTVTDFSFVRFQPDTSLHCNTTNTVGLLPGLQKTSRADLTEFKIFNEGFTWSKLRVVRFLR